MDLLTETNKKPRGFAFTWKRLRASAVATATLLVAAGLLSAGYSALTQPVQAQTAAPAAPSGFVAKAPAILPKIDCQALASRGTGIPEFNDIAEAPTEITSARVVPATASQPEYCEVLGYVQTQIKFALKLPTRTWQGRYVQFGCGGWCGQIPETTFPSCRTELGGDFAVASTNDAHDGRGTVWAGANQQTRIDYAYRGVHVVSVAAKAIQKAYYGVAPAKSYWIGCSTGGREGLMEAQSYPRDFDGIIAGAPANLQSTNPIYMAWAGRTNTNADGGPILMGPKVTMLHAAVVKACDANDGITGDGLIGDPRDCRFDPASIACAAGANEAGCLTAAELAVVRTYYKGNFDAKGVRLDPRYFPMGSELNWIGQWAPATPPPPGVGPLQMGTPRVFGDPAARWFSFPIGKGKRIDQIELTTAEVARIAPQAEIYDAFNTNLKPFRDAGGKLLIYQGWADYGVTPSQTLTYYNAMRREMGGQAETDKFARLFMVPGMGHCGGGPTPNTSEMLLQMIAWVENGQAPERIVAKQLDAVGAVTLQRPVYRYPLVARYVGPADAAGPNVLTNYQPAEPAVKHNDHEDWAGARWIRARPPRG